MTLTRFDMILKTLTPLNAEDLAFLQSRITKNDPGALLSHLQMRSMLSERDVQTLSDGMIEYHEDNPLCAVYNKEAYRKLLEATGFTSSQIDNILYDQQDFIYYHHFHYTMPDHAHLRWQFDDIEKLTRDEALRRWGSAFVMEDTGQYGDCFGPFLCLGRHETELDGIEEYMVYTTLEDIFLDILTESDSESRDDHPLNFTGVSQEEIDKAWPLAEQRRDELRERTMRRMQQYDAMKAQKREAEKQQMADNAMISSKRAVFSLLIISVIMAAVLLFINKSPTAHAFLGKNTLIQDAIVILLGIAAVLAVLPKKKG